MEDALSIPEIRRYICLYLRYRDYKSCALVSRAWHESLVPWIWRCITICDGRPTEKLATIHKYRSHVRTLHIKWDQIPDETYEWFDRLQALHIPSPTYRYIQIGPLVALIQRNRSSLRIISGDHRAIENETLLWIFSECISLVSLDCLDICIRKRNMMDSFLQICSRLTTLHLKTINVSESTLLMLQDQIFTNIKHIKFTSSRNNIQLEFLRACPNLKSLFIYPHDSVSADTLLNVLINYCKQLCVIQFGYHRHYTGVDYEKLSLGLWPMKCLHWLSTPRDDFDINSVLTRHFQTLQALHLSRSKQCLGRATQIILSSCPNLRSFKGGIIYASDIEAGAAWVCHRIQHLELHVQVYVEEQHLHSVVCGRLSELTQLSNLSLGGIRFPFPISYESLSLRLGEGLELMGSLKRLENFGVGYLRDYWKAEEIEWMIKEWPILDAICGEHRCEDGIYVMVCARLGQSRIRKVFPNFGIMDFIEF